MPSLTSHFQRLDQLLNDTRDYWQCVAFSCEHYPWPELTTVLENLSDEQVAELDAQPSQLIDYFSAHIDQLSQLPELTDLPTSTQAQPQALPFWLSNGIKGRKLIQLQCFVDGLAPAQEGSTVLEWCAGKGHLGRLLAHQHQVPVHSVEIQQHLCEQGEQLADKLNLPIHFHQGNVLTDDFSALIEQCDHAVALHACGGLHQSLLRQACQQQTPRISISPCCYHLFIDGDYYQPMSAAAQASSLRLTSSDLKLALQQTVTAPQRVRRVRQKEVLWRLGFDQLVREQFKRSQYTPVPSVGKQIFSGEFSDFCFWAAREKGLTLPEKCDFTRYLKLAEQRKRMTERIELVRHLFRRAIEVWLVLDRALYLQQHNYQVDLSEFCETEITPRNILIEASINSEMQ